MTRGVGSSGVWGLLHAALSTRELKRLGLCGCGFLSPIYEFDAASAPGGSWCGVRVQRRSFWVDRLKATHTCDSLRARFPSRMDRPEAYTSCFVYRVFTHPRVFQSVKMGFGGSQYGSNAFSGRNARHAGVG